MDYSKLPKLSETPKPPPNEPGQQGQNVEGASYERADLASVEAGAGAMLWVSILIGLLCMWMGANFARYVVATLSGREYQTRTTWRTGPKAGEQVGYWDLEGAVAWTEAGIFLFGLAMVLEGIALAVVASRLGGKKAVLSVSLGVIVLATILNMVTAVKVMGAGMTPIWSVVAVAFGGYMAIYQWKLLRVMSTGRAVPMT